MQEHAWVFWMKAHIRARQDGARCGFWRQHRNYGQGAHHLHRLMRQRGDDMAKIERLGFYCGLVSYPIRAGGGKAFTQCALLLLSQIAMVSGYLRQKQRMRQDARAG